MSLHRIGVFGAGSIGCYVGGRLAAAGCDVVLVGRARVGETLRMHGLTLSDLGGWSHRVRPIHLRIAESAAALRDCHLVLVTVKSAGTAAAGKDLSRVLAPGAVVISLQNGVRNGTLLAEALPGQRVITGMVPFNVVNSGNGHFHQGSSGELAVQRHAAVAEFAPLFAAAGLPLRQHPDMQAVQWAKLLLNLNNAINALSGLPLKAELQQRAFRRCLALAQAEALPLLAATHQPLARLTPLPAAALPRLLGVPDFIFRLLAQRMLAIDPLARSSMWEDLEAGRRTEVDWINGEVVALAEKLGRNAPVNARLVALVREAEKGGKRNWRGEELLACLASH